MNFIYNEITNISEIEINTYLLDTKLTDIQSKHFINLGNNEKLNELSAKVDYKYSVFGSNHNSNVLEEKNRIINMSQSSCERPLRFVIDSFGRIWADNTHWCIAYILKYGYDVTIADVPAYIVDFRKDIPTIVNIKNTVYDSVSNINNAISCAKEIQNRVDVGWRDLETSYCIKNLIKELSF